MTLLSRVPARADKQERIMQMDNGLRENAMTGNGLRYIRLLGIMCCMILSMLVLPSVSFSKLAQAGNCTNCHLEKHSTSVVSLSVDGNELTLTPSPTMDYNHTATVSIPTSTAFEIDFIVDGMVRNNSSDNAIIFAPASTWATDGGTLPSVANTGTALVTNLTNWNTIWDGSDASMIGWNEPVRTASGAGPAALAGDCYTKNWGGTAWDEGNADACENSGTDAQDLDNVAGRMGSDVVLTTPSVGGSYILYLTGIGSGSTGSKGYSATQLTITVTAGGDVTPPVVVDNLAMTTDTGTHVAGDFTITADFTDNETAFTGCEYTINGGAGWLAGSITAATGTQTCSASITSQVDGTAIDARMRATSGGGLSAATTPVTRTVDGIAPTIVDDAPAGWQAGDVTVTFTTATDARSGIASSQYCVDATDTCDPSVGTTYVAPVLVTEAAESTQYFRYISTDNVGNVTVLVSKTIQIDKVVPTDGTLSITPGNNQLDLSWTAATDGGSGLSATNTYAVARLTGSAQNPDCTADRIAWVDTPTTSYLDSTVANGTTYTYKVCAYDAVNAAASTGTVAEDTPSASCSYATPSVSFSPAYSQQITTGGGNAAYTIQVTNNDSVDCSDTTFNLTISNTDGVNFSASEGDNQILVAPGATANSTLTVTDVSAANGTSTDVFFVTDADGNHLQSANSELVTTLMNIASPAATQYSIGDTVHLEFQQSGFYNGGGVGSLTITAPDGSAPAGFTNPTTMIEVEDGGVWILAYDWDTTGVAAGMYMVEISDNDNVPVARTFVNVGNPTTQLNFFADVGYTTPTDIFADGTIVYAEAILPVSEAGVGTSTINTWDGTVAARATASDTVTQPGTVFRYNFVANFTTPSVLVGDADWAYVTFVGTNNGGLTLRRPIQRNDAGCGSCTYSTPTVSIVTGNQTIGTDPGSANYTINVTNGDSVACGSTVFDLVPSDDNATWFNASIFTLDPLTVSPGGTGSTTMTVSSKVGAPNGQINNTTFTTALDVNHAASLASNSVATNVSVADVTAPTVTVFTAPATSQTQTFAVTFNATDNIAVTGWLINESSSTPALADPDWVGVEPTGHTVLTDGTKTLYAWAKDASGNISTSLSLSINVDSAAPTVTSFTTVAVSLDLNIDITQFLASDNIGVTHYMVTTSSTPPTSGDIGWLISAPVIFSAGGDGSYTLYPWAKDALGNVSTVFATPPTIAVDTTALAVTGTTPLNSATGVALNSQVSIDFNDTLDCSAASVSTTTITSDSPGWALFSCIGSQAIFTTSGQANLTTYNVSVTAAVKDDVGNALSPAPHNFSYETAAAACVYNDPTIAIAEASQDVITDSGSVNYTVTVNNNDTGSCGDTTFFLLATENPVTADFTESFAPANIITLAPGANGNITVTSTATAAILNGSTQTLDIKTDGSVDVNHLDSNQISRITGMNVPCNVAPSASFVTANQQVVTDGGSAPYTIQVQNDNPLACGSTAFDLVVVDDNAAAFTVPSVFTVDPLTVNPGGATNTTTLTVTSQVGATNGAINNSYFYTAVNGSIPQSGNSATRTTTINRPCVPAAPSFSHAVNQNIAADGSAVYNMTIINNDVDCAASTFTFSIVGSEVESNVGTFTLPSVFSAPNVSVASGDTNSTVTFTVAGNGTGVELDTLTSTVRITDATNHAGQDQDTVPVTTIKPFDPLVHSSASTGSTKHSGVGGWGIANAKYGEFTCNTCHEPATTNIKRIRTVLPSAPDISKGDFPGAGGAISFLDAAEPTTDFGDDTVSPRASSTRICEVCHTADVTKLAGVDKHAFNQVADSGHENAKDCTACHKHNDGFSKAGATCDSCHGYPPQPADAGTTPPRVDDGFGYQAVEGKGAHVEHVNHLATLAGVTLDPNSDGYGDVNVTKVCGVCHDMNGATHEMGGGAAANRNINFNSSTAFQFGPAAPSYNGVEDSTSAVTPKTCSNINCHFQTTPWWE